ncbi:MAG: relaxase/mobilization nuclease domain-containing protein [Micropepsaceae bacterium]
MILKGSQRSGGQNLAAHLMNVADNEHVRLHELRGFASDDLRGAFKEVEAISRGTACRQYLFSLSLNPPKANVPIEVFEQAIDRIEERLGLTGQPRAIVIHEKENRRHAHCVWSRIDAQTMTARQMSHFKMKLTGVSRELYLEHGWTLPNGLANKAERDPTNFTLAEWQQAKREEIDPRWLKQTAQDCWAKSDNAKSFARALEDHGLFLAKGDRRGLVVLDHKCKVWSLPRLLSIKTKVARERIGDPDGLPSVAHTQKLIGQRMTPAIRRHVDEARKTFLQRSVQLDQYKAEMTRLHRAARDRLAQRQTMEWESETRERAAKLPKGWRALWQRITGKFQETRASHEREAGLTRLRHTGERQALTEQQHAQRATLQTEFRKLRSAQAEQLLGLRRDIGRFLKLQRQPDTPAMTRGRGLGLRLER